MAGDPSAAERAHAAIKQRILLGKLPVRTRIDVEALARDLGLSSMPVRQALSVLTWEGLVRAGAHAGYEVALWSAHELVQLYGWRGTLLAMVLPISISATELKRIVRIEPYPQAVFNVMRLVEANANPELKRAAINADERLFAARRAESEVLGDVEGEFANLVAAIAERSSRSRALVSAYHRRRIQNAAALRERAVIMGLPNNGPH